MKDSGNKMTVVRVKFRFLILILGVLIIIFGYLGFSSDSKPSKEMRIAASNEKRLINLLSESKVNISELELALGLIKQQHYKEKNQKETKESDEFEFNINKNKNTELVLLCPDVPEPTREAKKDEFQYLPGGDIYVYSAYFDNRVRSSRTVKVIGVSPTPLKKEFYCQLYYKDGLVYSVKGTATLADKSGGHKWFKYRPHIFVCEEPLGQVPIMVALAFRQCKDEVKGLLQPSTIKFIKEDKVLPSVLVCVKTLYNYSHTHRLIEFLEFQRLLGASHVVLYDFDRPSLDVIRVINSYVKKGFLSVQPWKIPLTTSKKYNKTLHTEIRTYGQNAQINDCIYRHMSKYKYIVFQDPDEFIVPRDSSITNYTQLVDHVTVRQNVSKKTFSSLVVANSHFCLTGKQAQDQSPGLLTQQVNHIMKHCIKYNLNLDTCL